MSEEGERFHGPFSLYGKEEQDLHKKLSNHKDSSILLFLEKLCGILDKIATTISVSGFILMTVSIIILVLLRYVFKSPWTWGEEFCRYLMVYSVFSGIFIATREDAHVCVEVSTTFTKGKVKQGFIFAGNFCAFIAYTWLAVLAFEYTMKMYNAKQFSPGLHLPMWAVVGIIFVGFSCCVLQSGVHLWRILITPPEQPESVPAELREE